MTPPDPNQAVDQAVDQAPAKAGITDDEQGNRSAARVLLSYVLVFAGLTVAVDDALQAWGKPGVPNAAYGLLTTTISYLIVWAAGPRIAQYLGAQVGGAVASIVGAVRAKLGGDRQ